MNARHLEIWNVGKSYPARTGEQRAALDSTDAECGIGDDACVVRTRRRVESARPRRKIVAAVCKRRQACTATTVAIRTRGTIHLEASDIS